MGVIHNYSKHWHFETSVEVCRRNFIQNMDEVWGGESLPILDSCGYLGTEFCSGGSWDELVGVIHVQVFSKVKCLLHGSACMAQQDNPTP